MKIARLTAGAVLAASLFLGVRGVAQAQVFAETWVSGTVYDSGNNPVAGGTVFVQCNSFSRNGSISGTGTYAVSFPQTECKVGDSVTASASTGEGSGANSAAVQNTSVNGPVVDLDIAVVDITVPEFGLIGGAIAAIGGAGAFMYMRKKSMV